MARVLWAPEHEVAAADPTFDLDAHLCETTVVDYAAAAGVLRRARRLEDLPDAPPVSNGPFG